MSFPEQGDTRNSARHRSSLKTSDEFVRELIDFHSHYISAEPEVTPLTVSTNDLDTYLEMLNAKKRYFRYEVVAHEFAHIRAAQELGISKFRLGFYYQTDEDMKYDIGAQPFVLEVGPAILPNIARAAIAAAPIDPSGGDLRNMRALGYESLGYLAKRINLWNDREDVPLLIPLPRTSGMISDQTL